MKVKCSPEIRRDSFNILKDAYEKAKEKRWARVLNDTCLFNKTKDL